MRLYWVFKQNADVTRNKNSIGTRAHAKGTVPQNKAALGAVTDALTGFSADFAGKGSGAHEEDQGGKGGKNRRKGEPTEKKRKAGLPKTARKKLLYF